MTGRVEWRYTGQEHGEPLVTLPGLLLRLALFADNYNTPTMVHILFSHFIFYHCDSVLSKQYQQFHKNIGDYSKYSTLLSAFR